MKSLILIFIFCALMTQTHASEASLSIEFSENDTVEYWVYEDLGN